METDESNRILTEEECWDFLRDQQLGRLAFRLLDELYITPVNYVVDGRVLLFRTESGNKLFGVQLGSEVAFEVDEVRGETAVSVVARGRARQLPESEETRADLLCLQPWVDGPKYDVVEVSPSAVTGRALHVCRPDRRTLI